MCGIVAFSGKIDATEVLLTGLQRLEYRGYDSAGVALVQKASAASVENGEPAATGENGQPAAISKNNEPTQPNNATQTTQTTPANKLKIIRRKGKVAELRAAVEQAISTEELEPASTGIGHTRWATHGIPSEANAHPHRDCQGKIAVVHNGIIENHSALREGLLVRGHQFISQTDTEVVAHLIEEEYAAVQGDLALTVRKTVAKLSGSFALAICHSEHPGTIVVTRNDSPLVVGKCKNGALAASDATALIEHTRDFYYLEDRDIAVLSNNGQLEFFDPAGVAYQPTPVHIDWDFEDAQRTGFPDFMLKEIAEQPRVIKDTIAGRAKAVTQNGEPGSQLIFDEMALTKTELQNIERVIIVACGTSYHAGLIGKDLTETWARLPVEVAVASEFRYRNPLITPETLVIAVSQSGETADTLEAVKLARRAGAHVLAITNVVGSRITMEANSVLYIKANLEIAVAATKSFLAQVALMTLLAMYLAQERGMMDAAKVQEIYCQMQKLPEQIEAILADTANIENCASQCAKAQTALFIGRGVGATTCYEGALKLKEISYLHAEAFSAGEIKHGPIALINPEGFEHPELQTPVIAVVCKSATYEKMLANIEEVQARGAKVIALATQGDKRIAELTPHVIYIPEVRECLSPILASVPLQMFARYIALARGANVDQPRNLAKSVTVE